MVPLALVAEWPSSQADSFKFDRVTENDVVDRDLIARRKLLRTLAGSAVQLWCRRA